MEYGCEMGEMINPSLRTQMTQQAPVRRSYQRSASCSSERDYDPHQRPHHIILNMSKESRPRNDHHHHSEMTKDQLVLARKALMDFGQTSKAHVKRSNQNKGFLFDDDGVDLLSRLADKRPEVIGGKVHCVNCVGGGIWYINA